MDAAGVYGGPRELSDGQSEAQSRDQMLPEVTQLLPRGWGQDVVAPRKLWGRLEVSVCEIWSWLRDCLGRSPRAGGGVVPAGPACGLQP